MTLLFFFEHTKIWLTILILILLSYTRTIHFAFIVAGGVFTKITVSILKQIIRQPRPYHSTATSQPYSRSAKSKSKSYGMPSTHSAVIIYLVTLVFLQLFHVITLSPLVKLLYSLMIYIVALLILRSRVELGHHTTAQVLMGMLLGITLAIFWNNLWVNHWMSLLHELKLDGKLGYNELEIIWNCANEFKSKYYF